MLEMVTIADVTDWLGSLLGMDWFWFVTGLELHEFEVWFGDDTCTAKVLSCGCEMGMSEKKS